MECHREGQKNNAHVQSTWAQRIWRKQIVLIRIESEPLKSKLHFFHLRNNCDV